jgi:hypothetical protein
LIGFVLPDSSGQGPVSAGTSAERVCEEPKQAVQAPATSPAPFLLGQLTICRPVDYGCGAAIVTISAGANRPAEGPTADQTDSVGLDDARHLPVAPLAS